MVERKEVRNILKHYNKNNNMRFSKFSFIQIDTKVK